MASGSNMVAQSKLRRAVWTMAAVALATNIGCATTTEVARGDRSAVAAERERQLALYLDTWLDRRGRVEELAHPILVANAELCGDRVAPVLGISWVTRGDLGWGMEDYRDALEDRYGVARRPTVVNVVEGGPADRAGLERWDVLVSLDGTPVPVDRWYADTRDEFADALREAAADGRIEVAVEREGRRISHAVNPATACASSVHLVEDDAVNAFADGRDVYVTMGMYRFVEKDLEMQAVIAHELAHNAEGHVARSIGNTAIGVILDAAVDAATGTDTGGAFGELAGLVFSKEFEREADYVSMYMLERAGIDAVEVPDFWRRIGVENPDAVVIAHTHPTTAERFVNLDEAYREIVAKRESGAPMVPTRK